MGEPHPALSFAHRHYRAVVDGTKRQTIRRRCDPRIEAGSVVRADVIGVASLEAAEVVRVRLGDLTEEDARAEGGYTLAEFRDLWRESYGAWNPDELVTVIRFRVVDEKGAS
jgi:hypothetical protein